MGKENDGPKGGDQEYCGQDWLGSFWLTSVEDVVCKLLGNEIDLRRERGGGYQTRCSDREEGAHCGSLRRGRGGEDGRRGGGIYIRNGTRRLGGGLFRKAWKIIIIIMVGG